MSHLTQIKSLSRHKAHPYFTQQELRETLDRYGIRLMSWYPLGHGDKSLLEEPVFAELGKKYGKTPVQIMLPDEWGVYYARRGTYPLVSRIHQNFFFFMTKRQIKTTRTLMPMTAG